MRQARDRRTKTFCFPPQMANWFPGWLQALERGYPRLHRLVTLPHRNLA